VRSSGKVDGTLDITRVATEEREAYNLEASLRLTAPSHLGTGNVGADAIADMDVLGAVNFNFVPKTVCVLKVATHGGIALLETWIRPGYGG
jgi:hypothetical protein